MVTYQLVEATDSLAVVRLAGRLDMEGMAAVEGRLREDVETRGVPTLLEMSWVEFIGSHGIGVLALLARRLGDTGAGLVLVNPTGSVKRTLQVSGITQLIPVAQDRNEALRLLGQA